MWTAFPRSLKTRGLHAVQLVISDARHTQAIEAVLIGAAWQRCRVHFLRNVLAQVPRRATPRWSPRDPHRLAQPDADHVRSGEDS